MQNEDLFERIIREYDEERERSQKEYELAHADDCKHESIKVEFDAEKCKGLTPGQVYDLYPPFNGICPDCGAQIKFFASFEHMLYLDN